jgi:hypothetical protein
VQIKDKKEQSRLNIFMYTALQNCKPGSRTASELLIKDMNDAVPQNGIIKCFAHFAATRATAQVCEATEALCIFCSWAHKKIPVKTRTVK